MDINSENNIKNEEIDDKLIIDHDYDGIQELDNRPPPWLMWMFYISIVWSLGYFGYYHLFWDNELPPQDAEYQAELLEAQAEMDKLKEANPEKYSFDETTIVLLDSEADLAAGKAIYDGKGCSACHGAVGEGNAVGPNLTDEAWLNGNSAADVFKVMKHGNPAKGMMAYKDQLTNDELVQLTSWILISLKGSNPTNAREAQGE